jgi:hypothetical protein
MLAGFARPQMVCFIVVVVMDCFIVLVVMR